MHHCFYEGSQHVLCEPSRGTRSGDFDHAFDAEFILPSEAHRVW